ncbi:MAG: hypothetical protein KBT45_08030, partial [Bacteroidales bacterium]|nr:hypothetical protein [Candidatus Colimorpha pelethequi]
QLVPIFFNPHFSPPPKPSKQRFRPQNAVQTGTIQLAFFYLHTNNQVFILTFACCKGTKGFLILQIFNILGCKVICH